MDKKTSDIFTYNDNIAITDTTIPHSTEHLYLTDDFNNGNTPLNPNTLPKSLTILIFGDNFNQSINNILPHLEKLETLEFGKNFNNDNTPLNPNTLPKSLTKLVFGDNFNQSINNILPHLVKLKTLDFGSGFNNGGEEFVANVFPKSLKLLKFNNDDKHPMVYKLRTINFAGNTRDITIKSGKSDVSPEHFPFNTIPPIPPTPQIPNYYGLPRGYSFVAFSFKNKPNNKKTIPNLHRQNTNITPPFTNNIDISKINFIRFDIETFTF